MTVNLSHRLSLANSTHAELQGFASVETDAQTNSVQPSECI